MYKAAVLALLVAGAVLVICGISASQSLASDVSRFFTGSPTEKATWMVVCGVVLFCAGLVGVLRRSKATT